MCGQTENTTLISTLQGNGTSVTTTEEVVVEGVLTSIRSNGFFLQEEPADSDGNDATSEGVWVYESSAPVSDKIVGHVYRVRGTPEEYNELSQLTWAEMIDCGEYTGDTIVPVDIALPFAAAADLEPFEGMMAAVTGAVIVSLDDFIQWGEIDVADSLRYEPTDIAIPLSAEYNAAVAKNSAPVLKIDDDATGSNPDTISYFPTLNYQTAPRVGYEVSATGPLSQRFDDMKILPTENTFTITGDRPVEDHERADLSIATYNVLNYFNGQYDDATDTVTFNYDENRGADTQEEFELQQARLVATLAALDADVVTLSEIENDGFGERSALKSLTDALNDALGDDIYAYLSPADVDDDGKNESVTGTDDITNAIIYKSAVVSPMGAWMHL